MAQPQMGRITCSQCGALYNSERRLDEHMKATHHDAPAQNKVVSQFDDTQQDGSKIPSREEQKTVEPRVNASLKEVHMGSEKTCPKCPTHMLMKKADFPTVIPAQLVTKNGDSAKPSSDQVGLFVQPYICPVCLFVELYHSGVL